MSFIFSKSSPMGTVSSTVNLKALVTPNTPNFTWGELLKTSIPLDNTPSAEQMDNLRDLAEVLQVFRNKFGPITINSGFRSDTIQNAMNTVGGPYYNKNAAGKSLHSQGKAADIVPSIPIAQFFANVISDPSLLSRVGEFANMTTFIHMSTPAPELNKVGYIMKEGYVHMTPTEVTNFISDYASAAYKAIASAAGKIGSYVKDEPIKSAAIGLGTIVAIGGAVLGALLMIKKMKK